MRPRYWFVSREASDRIAREIARDGRRSWNPLLSRPSLSDLQGAASRWRREYQQSRARLFYAADCTVTYRWHYFRAARTRRVVGFVRANSKVIS